MTKKTDLPWILLFALPGLGNLGNGLFMILAPFTWYTELPAGVPDFGPYNEHFVRDIGCIFITLGLVACAGAWSPRLRFPAALVLAFFFGAHALVHVFDTARGLVGPEHWLVDLPLTYLPAIIFSAMAWAARRFREEGQT